VKLTKGATTFVRLVADSIDMADSLARDYLEQQEDGAFSPARSAWIGGHGTDP